MEAYKKVYICIFITCFSILFFVLPTVSIFTLLCINLLLIVRFIKKKYYKLSIVLMCMYTVLMVITIFLLWFNSIISFFLLLLFGTVAYILYDKLNHKKSVDIETIYQASDILIVIGDDIYISFDAFSDFYHANGVYMFFDKIYTYDHEQGSFMYNNIKIDEVYRGMNRYIKYYR